MEKAAKYHMRKIQKIKEIKTEASMPVTIYVHHECQIRLGSFCKGILHGPMSLYMLLEIKRYIAQQILRILIELSHRWSIVCPDASPISLPKKSSMNRRNHIHIYTSPKLAQVKRTSSVAMGDIKRRSEIIGKQQNMLILEPKQGWQLNPNFKRIP